MLEDLDQITARIGQVVDLNRQLKAEGNALRARIDDAERTSRQLRDQCAQRDASLLTLQEKLNEQGGEVEQKLAQSHAAEGELREQLSMHLSLHETLILRLAQREADLERLKSVAATARARVDAVLARLPGAPVQEEL